MCNQIYYPAAINPNGLCQLLVITALGQLPRSCPHPAFPRKTRQGPAVRAGQPNAGGYGLIACRLVRGGRPIGVSLSGGGQLRSAPHFLRLGPCLLMVTDSLSRHFGGWLDRYFGRYASGVLRKPAGIGSWRGGGVWLLSSPSSVAFRLVRRQPCCFWSLLPRREI